MRGATWWLPLGAALCVFARCGGRTAIDFESNDVAGSSFSSGGFGVPQAGGAGTGGTSAGIICPPGQSVCGGTCIDEQTDNNNCGGCGIPCSAISPSTAACTLGRCLVTLASGDDFMDIAVGATGVYWTTYGGGTVMKVAIGGGTPTTLASGQNTPDGIIIDATSVYWTTDVINGTVMKVPIGGGTPTTFASAQGVSGPIAVDTTSVYYCTYGADGEIGTVMKVPVGGGARTTLASGHPIYIAVDATSVYWTDSDTSSGTSGSNGTVMKVPVGGGPPTVLASGQDGPDRIAVDATSVYWTDYNLNHGYSMSLMRLTPK